MANKARRRNPDRAPFGLPIGTTARTDEDHVQGLTAGQALKRRLSQRGASSSEPADPSETKFLAPRNLRTVRILRRTHQPAIETNAQASDAAMNVAGTLSCTVSENVTAKAINLKAPSTAPAASSAAASSPRRRPSSPASRLRLISCFSIRVALAQKMAGRARTSLRSTRRSGC
jgi:hypothetical protein